MNPAARLINNDCTLGSCFFFRFCKKAHGALLGLQRWAMLRCGSLALTLYSSKVLYTQKYLPHCFPKRRTVWHRLPMLSSLPEATWQATLLAGFKWLVENLTCFYLTVAYAEQGFPLWIQSLFLFFMLVLNIVIRSCFLMQCCKQSYLFFSKSISILPFNSSKDYHCGL